VFSLSAVDSVIGVEPMSKKERGPVSVSSCSTFSMKMHPILENYLCDDLETAKFEENNGKTAQNKVINPFIRDLQAI
jgi:hypothetical protein